MQRVGLILWRVLKVAPILGYAFVIAGALSWIGRWYQPDGEYTPEQVAQQCIATLCDGVLRRPADSTALNAAAVPAPKPRAARGTAKAAVRPAGG